MTKPKKTPKTGDVVAWAIVNRVNGVYDTYETRREARENLEDAKKYGFKPPYRLGKVVLAK